MCMYILTPADCGFDANSTKVTFPTCFTSFFCVRTGELADNCIDLKLISPPVWTRPSTLSSFPDSCSLFLTAHFIQFALLRTVPNGSVPASELPVCCSSLHHCWVCSALSPLLFKSDFFFKNTLVCWRFNSVCLYWKGLKPGGSGCSRSVYWSSSHASLAHCHPEAWRPPGATTWGCMFAPELRGKERHLCVNRLFLRV